MNLYMKTWLLQTVSGSAVFVDSAGTYTLANLDSNQRVEYFEGQLFETKEILAKNISEFLNVVCVWKPGPELGYSPGDLS